MATPTRKRTPARRAAPKARTVQQQADADRVAADRAYAFLGWLTVLAAWLGSGALVAWIATVNPGAPWVFMFGADAFIGALGFAALMYATGGKR